MKNILVVGSSVVDLTFYTDRIPGVGETVTGRFQQGLGGKGFNQAVASALSGATTRFISAVGPLETDAFSPLFAARLRQLKVEFALEEIKDAATGAAAISVDAKGQNNIIVSLGANQKLSPSFLDRHASFFENVDVLLMQFETNFKVIEYALKKVREKSPHAFTVLNPAPALTDIPREILNHVDLLTPNETELEIISGHKIKTDADLAVACSKITGPKAILATLGEKGCYYSATHKFYPAHKVLATDTSGAGDAFNGGLAAGWVRSGGNLQEAIRFASAVAAISVTRPGTSASVPTEAETLAFMAQKF